MKRPSVLITFASALLFCRLAYCGEIHDAAGAGDVEKVKALLKVNPELVNSKDDKLGMTPLHEAALNGHKEVVALLLANKADVNAKNNDGGMTPLHFAMWKSHKDVAELLLENKADVNAKNDSGGTPLHFAAMCGRKEIVELLLVHKADINAKLEKGPNAGETPLVFAIYRRQHIEKREASPERDAELRRYDETIAFLRKAGAKE